MSTPHHGGSKTGALNGYQFDFYGNDFTWFIAFVEEDIKAEDGYDKLNRVRIRIWGLHDFNSPIEECPLAQVLMPTTVGGVHDIGSIFGLEKGAQVFGFWLDRHKQHPVIVGSLVGKQEIAQRFTTDVQQTVQFTQAQASRGDGFAEVARRASDRRDI